MTVVRPIAEPREFALQELFFSTTDEKGRIVYGNPVFTRISGYQEGELFGQPHNVIRHPDMPRCVFKLLWDYIQAGRTVAAYVKNMAKDGRYYWVLAVVTPCRDGYLSIRLKPSSPLLAVVQDLYREALAIELSVETETANRKTAMQASTDKVLQRLRSRGFDSYDEFMREALSVEMAARRKGLEGCRSKPQLGFEASELAGVERACHRIGELQDDLFASLDLFKQLNRELDDKSAKLFDVAETLHFESLNAKIAAGKLEHGAAVLGAISRELSASSRDTEELIGKFVELTRPMTQLIGDVVFDVATARLEAEICGNFAVELATHASQRSDEQLTAALRTLVDEMTARVRAVDERLHELIVTMKGLGGVAEAIMAKVIEMKAVQFAGNKESLSRRDAGGFVNIFSAVGDRIARGKEDCGELIDVIDACRRSGASFVGNLPEILRLMDGVENHVAAIEAGALAGA